MKCWRNAAAFRMPVAASILLEGGQDPMQYGHGEAVPRWGIAGFHAAPGWCALRSAPFDIPEALIDFTSREGSCHTPTP